MKLSVIALDYDGTTARYDVMGPQVRDAIAAAPSAGIIVLLVTGRRAGQRREGLRILRRRGTRPAHRAHAA